MRHPNLSSYIESLFCGEKESYSYIINAARANDLPEDWISAEEGKIIQLLLDLAGATHVVEIGTLAGYSAAWISNGITSGRRLISIDRDPKRSALAAASVCRLGPNTRVEFVTGEASDILAQLAGGSSSFDACVIDADWGNYPRYVSWALENVRRRGLILAHNATFFGLVHIDPDPLDAFLEQIGEQEHLTKQLNLLTPESRDELRASLRSVRKANRLIATDSRVSATILPTLDGILIGLLV